MTGALAERTRHYVERVAQIAQAARNPGFNRSAWDELDPLVATDVFMLIGRSKQEMAWTEAVETMNLWATKTIYAYEVRRLEESGALVFMELDERSSTSEGGTTALNTMTVFEFDADGKIRRIDAFQ